MNKHTKNTLILKVYETSEFQLKDVRSIVNSFLNLLTEAITSGENVEICGLGTFSVKKRKKTRRYNLQKKAVLPTGGEIALVFTPSRILKKTLTEKSFSDKTDVFGANFKSEVKT